MDYQHICSCETFLIMIMIMIMITIVIMINHGKGVWLAGAMLQTHDLRVIAFAVTNNFG